MSDVSARRQARVRQHRGVAIARMYGHARIVVQHPAQGVGFARLQFAAGNAILGAQRVRQQPGRAGVGIGTVRSPARLHRGEVAGQQRIGHFARQSQVAAAGLEHPHQLRPWHVIRRVSPTESKHYGEMYEYLKRGALLATPVPKHFERAWNAAQAKNFETATLDQASLPPA